MIRYFNNVQKYLRIIIYEIYQPLNPQKLKRVSSVAFQIVIMKAEITAFILGVVAGSTATYLALKFWNRDQEPSRRVHFAGKCFTIICFKGKLIQIQCDHSGAFVPA